MTCSECEYWARNEYPDSEFKMCYRPFHDGKFKAEGSDVIVTLPDFGCNQFCKRVVTGL
jgi:hypothetical protein